MKGFTLVELMLAMAFIGGLLIIIAMTTIQIMGTYARGLTIREVNQAGRTISEDIQSVVTSAAPFVIDPIKEGETSDTSDSMYVQRQGGGRLCTGSYTYAWNYGNTEDLGAETTIQAHNTYSDSEDVIRFVKVEDTGSMLCVNPSQQIQREHAKELLPAGDSNLAVQGFTITVGSWDDISGQALYAIKLILGTNDQAQLDATSLTCLPPIEGEGRENFCAINQFDIVVRAGNRSGSL